MTALDLRSVIRKQGFFIGGSGLAAGIVLGLGVVAGQQTFGWIRLPTDIYAFSHLPMIITLRDVIVIPAIGILCIFSATQVAIHRALKIHARDAIQTEK
ncbi:MAG: hypothetical protein D6762_04875 [Candidatus Neomarinimicrobiota bacterium]|nr:MAG: hypothetical protein D6762_04875 [Candidatus Neomarinimicrobiota bacterium]